MLRSFYLLWSIMKQVGGDFMNTILPKIKSDSINSNAITKRLKQLINTLYNTGSLAKEEYLFILDHISIHETDYLFKKAYLAKQPYYQNRVFLRGLIEVSNYCKRGCKYCGINRNNSLIQRFRLSTEEILDCCKRGYLLGYRTFVLQGGEDPYFTDEILTELIKQIKTMYPDTRITLSLGERSYQSYQTLYQAGADRYLLRHEAASRRLYEYLHPSDSLYDNRMQCLRDLKEIGFQTGAGFMVGSPTQTNEDLVADLQFLESFQPEMIGVGPYLCHEDTELKGSLSGTLTETLIMVALTRLVVPTAMLPATTALGTLDKLGRENALNVGANVMMPNIGPVEQRELYEIYQNKRLAKDTDEQNKDDTEQRILAFSHVVDYSVGDVHAWKG